MSSEANRPENSIRDRTFVDLYQLIIHNIAFFLPRSSKRSYLIIYSIALKYISKIRVCNAEHSCMHFHVCG